MVFVVGLALSLTHVITKGSTRAGLQEGDHRFAEETIGVAHGKELAVLRLGKDAEIDCGDILVAGIRHRRTVLHELEAGELLEGFFAKFVPDLVLGELALLLNIETDEIDMILGLPAGETGKTNFGSWWRWETLYAGDLDLVLADLLHFNVLDPGGDVAVVILRTLNLVKKLRCAGRNGNLPTSVLFLGHYTFPLLIDSTNREA
jgi:hypothetical protein